ncbi:uncharacterized protein G2W53_030311 [Senna tora]|uniref:Uncharacterized protein n=1 Tax=Senna tora TaxID=362788 RepID=A0A834T6T1_9FABA|nr:uncharacterized protein G2W53_030311 [Senna tora]
MSQLKVLRFQFDVLNTGPLNKTNMLEADHKLGPQWFNGRRHELPEPLLGPAAQAGACPHLLELKREPPPGKIPANGRLRFQQVGTSCSITVQSESRDEGVVPKALELDRMDLVLFVEYSEATSFCSASDRREA